MVCTCLFITGCQGESETEEENISTDEQVSPPKDDNPPNIQDQDPALYQVNTTSYQNGDLIVHYPQLTGMENKTKEKQINNQLKNDVLQFVNQYENDDASLNMNYEVMMDTQDTLSILYTGDYSVEGGIYPSHFLFTTNIDMRTGEKIRLPDRFSINEEFINKFKTSPYIDRENPASPNKEKSLAVKNYLDGINQPELIEAFNQADLPTAEENLYGIFSYFQEDGLIISIGVPHVIGDHAEFQVEMNE